MTWITKEDHAMSRSRRRPYTTITGTNSAKEDKRLAHRGLRRAQDRALRQAQDFDAFLVPHRYEASWNDVWGWGRDGKQHLEPPPRRGRYLNAWRHHTEAFERWFAALVRYYQRLHRK